MTITARQIRSFPDLKELPEDAQLAQVVQDFNNMVRYVTFTLQNMSIQSNFNCQVIELEFTSSEQKRVFHRLGSRPSYRLILRQEGNGLITDVPTEWNDKYVTLKNNGSVSVKATIVLLKE